MSCGRKLEPRALSGRPRGRARAYVCGAETMGLSCGLGLELRTLSRRLRAQVYGAVTMNNTLCLGLFLLVIHLQDLPWTYSSEVAVTVVATLLVGLLGATRRTFATFWAIPVLLIYPLSIVGVWGLDAAGWR